MSATSKARILVIEDEEDIKDLICLHLHRDGYTVDSVMDGEDSLRKLAQEKYDLIVLDWMLPGMNGLDITKELRGRKETLLLPILMVTARMEAVDIVLGLEAGADDYVTKPFEVPVLLARVRALLRRVERTEEVDLAGGKIIVGPLEVDTERFTVKCGGEDVSLTTSEFKLLLALMQNRGRVLTRDRLIDCVQGAGVTVIDRAIDTHVFGLRKKLGNCAEIVETVRGVGYRVRSDLDV